jgi:dTDP-glucose pyrophosphorylase
MWGIIPAAGNGTRIQPLAFSKELLPVGSRRDSRGVERPRAVSEYLVERMVSAGADRICFVISPWKTDIVQYYRGAFARAAIAYVIQDQAQGLCDAIFRSLPLLPPNDSVIVGLPDTIWFPANALAQVPDDRLSFLLFPVERPELFDAVVTDAGGTVQEIQVKTAQPRSHWVWGAFRAPVSVMLELYALWRQRGRQDEYIGTLVNAWLAAGGVAAGVRAGRSYVDVGTLHGYREAMQLLSGTVSETPAEAIRQ